MSRGGIGSRPAAVVTALLLGGCDRQFSTVNPAGPQAERISDLTWVMVWLGTAVYVVVIGAMLYAAWRSHRRAESLGGPEVERKLRVRVGAAVGVTLLVLLFLLVHDYWTGRQLAAFAEPDAMTVHVTGHQWWWEFEYQDRNPSRRLTTANELHIPVGRRVRVDVTSGDVIHSFWAPNLHGKLDATPGYTGTTYFRADRPGVYHGRCAEFCGHQHAHMDFLVIAEPPGRFAAWYEHQLRSAPPPADPLAQKGQQVFLGRACAMCHAIRGTPAGSHLGPDLTHLGSRRTIGAVTLPNTRGHLGGWVMDPQRIKPGVKMPPNGLAPDELQALLSYLEGLK